MSMLMRYSIVVTINVTVNAIVPIDRKWGHFVSHGTMKIWLSFGIITKLFMAWTIFANAYYAET